MSSVVATEYTAIGGPIDGMQLLMTEPKLSLPCDLPCDGYKRAFAMYSADEDGEPGNARLIFRGYGWL